MTKLCASLTDNSCKKLISSMSALPDYVDAIELRLDYLDTFEDDWRRLIQHAVRQTPYTVIVTNRPTRAGGYFQGEEDFRIQSLQTAATLGADYVDVELDSSSNLGAIAPHAGRIVSYHNFDETPESLETILARLVNAGADVPKIAVKAQDLTDSARVLKLLASHSSSMDLIALAMGEEGQCTRILAPKFDAFLSFCSADEQSASAPGQVSCREMEEMYHFSRIGPETQVYGVIANPVSHSMSPAIHNAAFEEKGMDAVYLPLKVTDPASFLDAFQKWDLRGLSVTIPYKEAVVPLMDELDEMSRRIGAVNTVNIRHNRRFGSNTDAAAALDVLRDAAERADILPLTKRDVLMVGAGGAGRALAYVLADRVGKLTITNRTHSRARKLAREVDAQTCPLDDIADNNPDILINTTSVGMHPDVNEMPVPTSFLEPGMVVFDAVYNPIETLLLQKAKEKGCVTASGFEWFVSQAAAQFETWVDQSAPRELMANVVEHKLTGRK